PHLARAFALTRAMRQAVAPHELENAIESVGTAALLLDVGGRTVGRNRNAEQLLADCPVVSIEQLGRLRLAGADAQQQLDRLLVRLENDDRFRLPDAIALG